MKTIEKHINKILAENKKFHVQLNKIAGSDKKLIINNANDFIQSIQHILNNELVTIDFNSTKNFKAQHFIFQSIIALNFRIYNTVCIQIQNDSAHFWENKDKDQELFILLLYKQIIHSMLSSYMLLCKSLHFQSMQLFRGYIESSAILYLSLLDDDFLEKYSYKDKTNEDYTKLWFKKLKPSAVKSGIKKRHEEWYTEDSKKNVEYIGLRGMPDLWNSDAMESFYKNTSNYVHYKFQTILHESYDQKDEAFYIGLKPKILEDESQILLDMCHTSSDVTMYVSRMIAGHINFKRNDQLVSELSMIVHDLVFQYIYNQEEE